ncbi:hypothetical protein JST99_05205 [Candidatus Dependentiae bacterium]|nr:hypothetical protein [Candidatus Dependentiae bacterium]MCC7415312.1 hypothetical protein [Campylobacterota bacterium]
MLHLKKSRAAKIILVCLCLSIVEKGWVTKTHPFALGAVVITQEALYALTLGCSMLWRACTNSNNSAVDRLLQSDFSDLGVLPRQVVPDRQEVDRITHAPSIVKYDTQTYRVIPVKTGIQCSHLSKACYTNTDNPSSALSNPSHVSSHVHETPVRPVPLVRTSPASIKKIERVADKARAVVSHVTQEQVVQATYAAIPEAEKIASQELVHHVAVDWRKHVEHASAEAIRSAQADAYNHTELHASNLGYMREVDPNGGVTYRAPNSQFYCYLGPSRQQHTHSLANDIAENRLNEQIQIQCDPYARAAVANELCGFLNNAHRLIYGTLLERIAALIHLGDFRIEFSTFGDQLYDVQRQIYARYAHTDGSVCTDRLSDMTAAHTIIKKYVTRHKKVAPLFEQSCEHARSSCPSALIKKKKVDLNALRNNRTNQCYKNMLAAFSSGDMHQVELIKNSSSKHGVQIVYKQIRTAYNTCVAQQEALLKDQYGIIHFNLPVTQRDPLFTALSDHDRTQLYNNPQALASFNNALLLRNRYKNALHKAWNIPTSADPMVHQALYALVDCGTIPERIDKIHELVSYQKLAPKARHVLMQAFFLPNGIIKDFTEYDRAQSLQMPTAILEEEHTQTRLLLNHLVYAERICADEQIKSECAEATECIQYAVAADHKEHSAQYIEQAQSLYAHIHNLTDDEKTLGICGTGNQENISLPDSECLPGIGDVQPSISHCPSDGYQDRIEKEKMRDLIDNPDAIPDPQPCGFAGQTLPDFGFDDDPSCNDGNLNDGDEENQADIESGHYVEKEDRPSDKITDKHKASNSITVPEKFEIDTVIESATSNTQTKTVEELINESEKVEPRKGPAIQYKRRGGYMEAVKDFYSLNPQNVRDIPKGNTGKLGQLPDGREINVRINSSGDGYPTLEIQNKHNKDKIKFRYTG